MRRVHAIVLVCLDTGCRVKEVLGLRFGDVDLNAMVLLVLGKGRRERLIPFSPELRGSEPLYDVCRDEPNGKEKPPVYPDTNNFAWFCGLTLP